MIAKLFCNENGYFSVFYVLSYLLFPLIFVSFACVYVVSCPVYGCHVFLLLDSGCSHSVVQFVLTTV
jgi:hypothetical protein